MGLTTIVVIHILYGINNSRLSVKMAWIVFVIFYINTISYGRFSGDWTI